MVKKWGVQNSKGPVVLQRGARGLVSKKVVGRRKRLRGPLKSAPSGMRPVGSWRQLSGQAWAVVAVGVLVVAEQAQRRRGARIPMHSEA